VSVSYFIRPPNQSSLSFDTQIPALAPIPYSPATTTLALPTRDTSCSHLITSVEPGHSEFRLSIFPNPVHDDLHINLKSKSEDIFYSIYDVTGKIINEHRLISSDGKKINVSFLSPGFYLLRITDEKNIFHAKFIKE
jgi:hypothetical protein